MITKTGLDYIEKSPLDYWHRFVNPNRNESAPDASSKFEEILRCAILTPEIFKKFYVREPKINKATNIGKSEYAALLERVSEKGQTLVSGTDYDIIEGMRKSVAEYPATSVLFSDGQIGLETALFDSDSETIVSFAPHWVVKDKYIVYISSTKDASAGGFSKECLDRNHHKRAAIQIDGTGIDLFVFVMVEKSPPYKLKVHTLDDRSIELGRSTYKENCQTFAECLETDIWPGLPSEIKPIGLPDWAFNKKI